MLFLDTLVEKPEPSDHVTSLVGEERKRDPILLGDGSEDRDGVIADGEQRDAIRAESRPYILQLDQLRPAERSPVGAAVEDDECLPHPAQRVQIDRGAALVG
jgi:hypothetical protein